MTTDRAANSLNIAVVGGGGYIGSVLCPHLLRRGHRLRILDRFFFGMHTLDDTLEFEDRREIVRADNRAITPKQLENMDAVVDLSGLSNDPCCALDEDLTESINLNGGTNVLTSAKAAGVRRYVYQSTCSVYGAGGAKLLTEESSLAPVSLYARSKRVMEERVLEAAGPDFEVALPRIGTVYGVSPRMRFDLIINVMTKAAMRNGRIFVLGGGRQWRPLIHVGDVARALRTYLEAPAEQIEPRIFNTGASEHNYQAIQIARLVERTVPNVETITVPDDPDKRSYRVDFSRWESTFGVALDTKPTYGIEEVYKALLDENIDDGMRSQTVNFYQYLAEAKAILDEVILDGRLL